MTTGNYNEVIFPGAVDAPRIESRAVAPIMTVEWEPVTNKCSIRFVCQRYLLLDGVWVKAIGMDEKMPDLTIQVSDDFTKCWGYPGTHDPVTAAALDRFSMAGMMEVVKAAFEQAYDQVWNQRYPAPPAPEPEPETPPPEEGGF